MERLEQELEKNNKPEIKLNVQIKNLEESAAVIVEECDEIEVCQMPFVSNRDCVCNCMIADIDHFLRVTKPKI